MATINNINTGIPITLASGGTNATSMATSTGLVKYDGTSLVTSSAAKIDSSNRTTNTAQPCFNASLSSTQNDVTGDGTVYTIIYNTVAFDQNSNYNSGTGVFTAPLTGLYLFCFNVGLTGLTSSHTSGRLNLLWNADRVDCISGNFWTKANPVTNFTIQGRVMLYLTASDTIQVQVLVTNGTKVVDIVGSSVPSRSWFAGYLMC